MAKIPKVEIIKNNIKHLLKEKNENQVSLSDGAGVNRTTIYNILAKKAIYMALFSNIIIITLLYISVNLPSLKNWSLNDSYNYFITQIFMTLFASSVAFFTSEILNSWVLCKIKELTNTKFLFLRILISTSVAALFDSFIFCFIAFYGKMEVNDIISMAILQFFIKLFYAVFNIFPAYGTRYLFQKYLVRS